MIQVAFTLPIMLDDFKSADNLFFNALSGELSYELEAAELVQSELRAAHAAAEALKKEQAALQDKLEGECAGGAVHVVWHTCHSFSTPSATSFTELDDNKTWSCAHVDHHTNIYVSCAATHVACDAVAC